MKKYCHFTSLKRFLELLQWHFARVLSVNITEIHKSRPVFTQHLKSTLCAAREILYWAICALPPPVVPSRAHFGSSELFPCNHSNVTQQWQWAAKTKNGNIIKGPNLVHGINSQKNPQTQHPSSKMSPWGKKNHKKWFLNELILFSAAGSLSLAPQWFCYQPSLMTQKNKFQFAILFPSDNLL